MWLERKYTSLLSTRLERFKLRGNVASFRCPVCGDSKTNKYKTRGTIVLKPEGSYFYCHNCSATKKFGDFLRLLDQSLFDDYLKEHLGEKYTQAPKVDDSSFDAKPEFKRIDDKLAGLRKVSQLGHDHPVRAYVESRLIPASQHYRIYYTPKFKHWTNSIIPGKFESVEKDEPRLILPFLDKDGVFYGFQGRSFRRKINPQFRYITIMADPDRPKVFGLDATDLKKPFKVVEGPIDSLFVKNCIATAGGKLQAELAKMNADPRLATVIYDNEPRNAAVVKNIEGAIADGFNVVIWPETERLKDVNDMILGGRTDINQYLDAHTYSALRAKLELQRWRKT